MRSACIAAVILAVSTFPAAAQTTPGAASPDDMTCSAFADLSAEDQAKTIEDFQTQLEAGGMMASGDAEGGDMTEKVASACEGNPDMTVGDAMNSASSG